MLTYSPELKAHVLKKLIAGESRYSLSKKYGPSLNTITKWAKAAGIDFSYHQVNTVQSGYTKQSICVEKYHG